MRYGFLIALLFVTNATADPPRARPPEFTDDDRAAFFDDAFAILVGDRPEPTDAVAATEAAETEPAAEAAWNELIAPDVLETEIKRQATRLGRTVRSASAYKAGGYQEAADALGVAATMFAVTAEHTGQPRWRDTAAALRDLLAESYEAADEATDGAHQTAAARAADLEDLVRGGRPSVPDPQPEIDWSDVASRTTLMRRMGEAEEQRLRGWAATERALARNAEDARHEAQVLAALAEAILQPEAYDFDDPDYAAHARRLREAAQRLAAAAEAEDQPAAAEAMSEVSRSCVDCHADYRG